MMGFQRRCVRCAGKTAMTCDRCDDTYREVLLAPVARGAAIAGRALCNQCDEQFGCCQVCETEQLPQPEGEPDLP